MMSNTGMLRSRALVGIASVTTIVIITATALSGSALAQVQTNTFNNGPHDPGVRGGPPGAGGPLPGLNGQETDFFRAAANRFQEIDSVSGKLPGEAGAGLGPRFNLNSCGGCHAQPAAGGTSPAI